MVDILYRFSLGINIISSLYLRLIRVAMNKGGAYKSGKGGS